MARKVNTGVIIVLLALSVLAVDQIVLDGVILDGILNLGDVSGGEGDYSRFTATIVKKDAVATDAGTEIAAVWYDWNGDGAFAFDEVEQCTTASGVFTTGKEYPIGKTIYVQFDDAGESYQTEVFEVMMSGTRNSDGSAKTIGYLEATATEDALTWYGLVGGVSIDDGTDYNYTANGATKNVICYASLATSDTGFNNQHEDKFAGSDAHSFYSWIGGGAEDTEYMETFFGFYCTNQDAIDLGLKTSQFDYYHVGATNTFCAIFLPDGGGEFYDSDDSTAPTWEISFDVVMTAAGALIYVGLFQDCTLNNFYKDIWNPTTDANILGTCGADWDWVA